MKSTGHARKRGLVYSDASRRVYLELECGTPEEAARGMEMLAKLMG